MIGGEAISLLLKQNCTIQSLLLDGCHLGPQGIEAIALALWDTNMTVKTLALSDNKGGNNGAGAIAQCLRDSSSLTKLDLSNNGIDSACTAVLVSAIEQNSQLKALDLSSNNLGVDGLRDLIQVVALHPLISSFDVRYTVDIVGVRVDDIMGKKMSYCKLCQSMFNGKMYTHCNICNRKGPIKSLRKIIRLY